MGIVVAAIFAVDVALYGYWGFRLDATLFFYLQSPADAMASVPVGTFLLQFALFGIYAFYGIFWLFKRFIVPLFPATPAQNRLGGTIIVLLLAGILFIPIRGGVTTSTANVGMVYFSKNQFLNHSAINPAFSLLASLSKQQDFFAAQFNFFPEEERKERYAALTLSDDSLTNDTEKVSLLTTDRPNILIILMESFYSKRHRSRGRRSGCHPESKQAKQRGDHLHQYVCQLLPYRQGIVAVLNGYLKTTDDFYHEVSRQKARHFPLSPKKPGRTGICSRHALRGRYQLYEYAKLLLQFGIQPNHCRP